MKILHILLKALKSLLKMLFPKSRFGNVIYLVIGFLLANWESLNELIESILKIFD
jgi:hypothetical protein